MPSTGGPAPPACTSRSHNSHLPVPPPPLPLHPPSSFGTCSAFRSSSLLANFFLMSAMSSRFALTLQKPQGDRCGTRGVLPHTIRNQNSRKRAATTGDCGEGQTPGAPASPAGLLPPLPPTSKCSTRCTVSHAQSAIPGVQVPVLDGLLPQLGQRVLSLRVCHVENSGLKAQRRVPWCVWGGCADSCALACNPAASWSCVLHVPVWGLVAIVVWCCWGLGLPKGGVDNQPLRSNGSPLSTWF
jgi:hypothetical protein